MSDTPRTDALRDNSHADTASIWGFARQLERELETVKKILVAVENQRNELMGTFRVEKVPYKPPTNYE